MKQNTPTSLERQNNKLIQNNPPWFPSSHNTKLVMLLVAYSGVESFVSIKFFIRQNQLNSLINFMLGIKVIGIFDDT